MIGYYSTTVTTDGSGDGTATWSESVTGILAGVRISFGASPAAGTDTTLSESRGLERTIKTWTDTNTAETVHPAAAIDGATDAYLPYYIDTKNLLVTVAQGGDTKTVTVTLLIEDGR